MTVGWQLVPGQDGPAPACQYDQVKRARSKTAVGVVVGMPAWEHMIMLARCTDGLMNGFARPAADSLWLRLIHRGSHSRTAWLSVCGRSLMSHDSHDDGCLLVFFFAI